MKPEEIAESIINAAAARRRDPARVSAFALAVERARVLLASAPVRTTAGYREARWGDPGYVPRDRNFTSKTIDPRTVDIGRSQLVLRQPRFWLYHLVMPNMASVGFGRAAMNPMPSQYREIHHGLYADKETEAPLIALDLLEKHVHEEQLEPAKHIDAIFLQMPEDGGWRRFRRSGPSTLEEVAMKQPKATTILRGLGAPAGFDGGAA